MTFLASISLDIEYTLENDKWGNVYPVITEIDAMPCNGDAEDGREFSVIAKRAIYERLWEDTDMPADIDEYKAGMKDRSVIDERD
jgi:hypothetical protein